MNSMTEPTDVGPAAGGHLRASDDDRRRVTALLEAAHAEGRITTEERDQRVAIAATATTFDDLVPLTRDLVALDLPAPGTAPVALPTPRPAGVLVTNTAATSESRTTVFSSHKRTGRWTVPTNLHGLVLFGDQVYDMTQATFEADVVELNVFCMFGDVQVLVPAGVRVVDQTTAIFADAGAQGLDDDITGPTVVITGFILFGDVKAYGPRHRSWAKRLKRLSR